MSPGARLESITNLADGEISSLGNKDMVTVIGGTNDISRNETNLGLTYLRKFVDNWRNTNILVLTAPHRYDLLESSWVNKEVEVFNRKLLKVVKSARNVKIIQATLKRSDFTHHGMHLEICGKEKTARLIGDYIRKLIARKEETPCPLKWKDEHADLQQKETMDKPTNIVNKEPILKATGLSKGQEETQEQSEKPPHTSATDPNTAPARSSNHIKKAPSTRNEDFLWLTSPLARVH